MKVEYGLLGDRQSSPAEVVAKKVEAAFDPADERLLGMFLLNPNNRKPG
jgi:hypothetical protein